MANSNLVKFKTGTRAAYEALASKDENTLYFLSDTYQIMKGDQLYCKSFTTVDTKPADSAGVKDTLYIVKNDKKLYTFNGTTFVEALDASVTIDDKVVDGGVNPVTAEAIYTFVTGEIAKLTGGSTNAFVTSVTANNEALGTLTVAKGTESTDVAVNLNGLAKAPTYEENTRTFTFPNVGGDPLVVSLGKDLVVTDAAYDSTTHNITLTIDGGGENNTAKVITIPVGDLVDTYTAGENYSKAAKITIASNTINAEVLVDGTTIKISEAGQLYADFTSLVTNETFEALQTQVNTNTTNLNTLTTNFNNTKKDLEDRVKNLEDNKAGYVTTTTLESNYYNKTAIDGKVQAINNSIGTVTDTMNESLTWVTIA